MGASEQRVKSVQSLEQRLWMYIIACYSVFIPDFDK